MRKSIQLLLCTAAAAAFSASAAARGPGEVGGTGFDHGTAGGPPASSGASQNSNGRFAQDRDTGLDRAEDRMSQQGLQHEKATDTDSQKKHVRHHRAKPDSDTESTK